MLVVKRNACDKKTPNEQRTHKDQEENNVETKVDALRQSIKLLDLDLTHGTATL